MISRISNHEKDVLHIVQALLMSRLTYHVPYHNHPLFQTQTIDALLRKAVKATLGLPPHASTQQLQLGIHNTVGELLKAHCNGQLQRLRCSCHGCAIRSHLGNLVPETPTHVTQYRLTPALCASISSSDSPHILWVFFRRPTFARVESQNKSQRLCMGHSTLNSTRRVVVEDRDSFHIHDESGERKIIMQEKKYQITSVLGRPSGSCLAYRCHAIDAMCHVPDAMCQMPCDTSSIKELPKPSSKTSHRL